MPKGSSSVRVYFEVYIPNEGNSCKTLNCNGTVVKDLKGSYLERLFYSIPYCPKCGRMYYFARNVHVYGLEKIEKLINESEFSL